MRLPVLFLRPPKPDKLPKWSKIIRFDVPEDSVPDYWLAKLRNIEDIEVLSNIVAQVLNNWQAYFRKIGRHPLFNWTFDNQQCFSDNPAFELIMRIVNLLCMSFNTKQFINNHELQNLRDLIETCLIILTGANHSIHLYKSDVQSCTGPERRGTADNIRWLSSEFFTFLLNTNVFGKLLMEFNSNVHDLLDLVERGIENAEQRSERYLRFRKSYKHVFASLQMLESEKNPCVNVQFRSFIENVKKGITSLKDLCNILFSNDSRPEIKSMLTKRQHDYQPSVIRMLQHLGYLPEKHFDSQSYQDDSVQEIQHELFSSTDYGAYYQDCDRSEAALINELESHNVITSFSIFPKDQTMMIPSLKKRRGHGTRGPFVVYQKRVLRRRKNKFNSCCQSWNCFHLPRFLS